MTRTLLAAIFLTLFSQTAWANAVYYCSGTHLVQVENSIFERFSPLNFKFSVDRTKIKYGNSTFFNGAIESITFWQGENHWVSMNGDFAITKFKNGEYLMTTNGFWEEGIKATLISAKCDKFE